jgi:hypothetical protein
VLERLLVAGDENNVDAVAMLGDIGECGDGYRGVFGALARVGCPVFWVPGVDDVPIERYLQEAFNIEMAFPSLRGGHGTAAATWGACCSPVSEARSATILGRQRNEREKLSYPRWEPEYRLKVLAEFDYSELVLLFSTALAQKGLQRTGSEAVAELIGTYRPRLVVCGGERGVGVLGPSTTEAPGSLQRGHYAVADLRERTAVLQQLAVSTVPSRAG